MMPERLFTIWNFITHFFLCSLFSCEYYVYYTFSFISNMLYDFSVLYISHIQWMNSIFHFVVRQMLTMIVVGVILSTQLYFSLLFLELFNVCIIFYPHKNTSFIFLCRLILRLYFRENKLFKERNLSFLMEVKGIMQLKSLLLMLFLCDLR